jgi:DNA replication protein DnaC
MNEIVYSVIDARYRAALPLIVTTNISMQEMMNVTEISRQRIYSRILEKCHPIAVTGADRRKQSALSDYAEMNKLLGL